MTFEAIYETVRQMVPEATYTGISENHEPPAGSGLPEDEPPYILTVKVGDEVFEDWLYEKDKDDANPEDAARRIRSDLSDWVAESGFGWGQWRE